MALLEFNLDQIRGTNYVELFTGNNPLIDYWSFDNCRRIYYKNMFEDQFHSSNQTASLPSYIYSSTFAVGKKGLLSSTEVH